MELIKSAIIIIKDKWKNKNYFIIKCEESSCKLSGFIKDVKFGMFKDLVWEWNYNFNKMKILVLFSEEERVWIK